MKRYLFASAAFAAALWTTCALAADKLVDLELGRKLEGPDRQDRGQEVHRRHRRRGRVHHRRHDRPAQQGQARQGLARKRHHLHHLACRLALCERRPVRDARPGEDARTPTNLVDAGQDQPLPHRHLGLRLHHRLSPRPAPTGIKFDSWADLWKPEIKGKLSAPDFDTSHLVAVAAKLDGRRCRRRWEKGQASSRRSSPTSRPSTPTTRRRSSCCRR